MFQIEQICFKISPCPYRETKTFSVFCTSTANDNNYEVERETTRINLHKDPDIIHIKILRQQRSVPKIDLPCGIPFVSLNKPSTRQSIDLPDFIVIFLFFTAFFF